MSFHLPLHRLLLAALVAVLPLTARAEAAVDAFSKCLAESTTGKDRKDLARWIFVAMGAHPEMRAIANMAPSAPDESSRVAGALYTRLIADTCATQARAAVVAVGPVAFQSAFTVLGQLAMQELMADKDVATSMGLLQKYIDSAKVQSVLTAK